MHRLRPTRSKAHTFERLALAPALRIAVTIDGAATRQTMQGFGATTISLVYNTKDNVPAPLRAAANDLAFKEIKLNMGNLEVEPSESPTSNVYAPANDDDDPATLNASGFNWVQSDNMMQKVVTPGKASGFTNFWLGPLISTTYALAWVNAFKSSNPTRYLEEIAEHVFAVLKHWKDTYGIDQPFVQLWNEPTSGNGELSGGGSVDLVNIVKACGARLRAEGFATKFVVPAQETEDISLRDATAILADPVARQYVGAIAYHPYPYGSTYASVPNLLASSGAGQPVAAKVTVRQQLRDLGAQYAVPVFMIEVSHSELPFTDFGNVRGRAIQIHDELEYANAAAFFGMNMFWDTVSHAEHFQGRPDPGFWNETDTLVLIDVGAGTANISPMGRAVGHFARHIKPGAVRVQATSSDPLVLVSAFRDDATNRQVLVAINNASQPKVITVALSGLKVQGSVTLEQSTASGAWVQVTPVAVTTASSYSITVPALSVTSLDATLFGAPSDAGTTVLDAGTTSFDAGVTLDSGMTPLDGGQPLFDAGSTSVDAGPADAGTAPTASGPVGGRCGCTAAPASMLWWALAMLLTRRGTARR